MSVSLSFGDAWHPQVDVDAVRSEHREGMASVKETMDEMVSQLPRGLKRDVGPTAAQVGRRPGTWQAVTFQADSTLSPCMVPLQAGGQRPDQVPVLKLCLFPQQGPVKRAKLFADSLSDSDSEESDAEELPAIAISAEAPAAPSALPAEAAAAAPSRLAVDTTTAAAPDRQASVTSPKQVGSSICVPSMQVHPPVVVFNPTFKSSKTSWPSHNP